MRDKGLNYSISLDIDFGPRDIAVAIFRSIQPEVLRGGIKDAEVTLNLDDSRILCSISSPSYGKFRGMTTTILRLMMVSKGILEEIKGV